MFKKFFTIGLVLMGMQAIANAEVRPLGLHCPNRPLAKYDSIVIRGIDRFSVGVFSAHAYLQNNAVKVNLATNIEPGLVCYILAKGDVLISCPEVQKEFRFEALAIGTVKLSIGTHREPPVVGINARLQNDAIKVDLGDMIQESSGPCTIKAE